ncbi:hypothetical protein [Vibrio sp. 3-2(1)]|uniref:hypothetical protein n=1 Tax=Vibrio sp. 3-2(1) TaxID=2591016 RepID=UPI00148379FC|nr:hypothetical protein [Vibrio sp. 3-2(1)]NNN70853.1 hypothetical protein [Vibrio sp. 3-2(1)]
MKEWELFMACILDFQEWFLSIFSGILLFLNGNFGSIVSVIASVFAIYFAFRKIGHKFQFVYSPSNPLDPFGTQIKSLVLTNCKDRTYAIWRVFIIIDGKFKLTIKNYLHPVAINPYETILIDCEKYSSIKLDDAELNKILDYKKNRCIY